MLERVIGADIKLHCDFAASLPAIEADQTMMDQVITNLAVNARDAILGLAAVHGIVKQHGGWIEVCSEVGKGRPLKFSCRPAGRRCGRSTALRARATA